MSARSTGVRDWWLRPPRRGLQRVIFPWEYRHLRGFGIVRIAGGSFASAIGLLCLSYSAVGWAAFFLAIAALDLTAGTWYLTTARSSAAR